MTAINCVLILAMMILFCMSIISILRHSRLKQEGDALTIRQFGGTYPAIGTGALACAALSLAMDQVPSTIGLGLAGIIAMAYRPLVIETRIDREQGILTNTEIRLWGKRRRQVPLGDISRLQSSQSSDSRGRRHVTIYLETRDRHRINLLVDLPAGSWLSGSRGYGRTLRAWEDIHTFLEPVLFASGTMDIELVS